MARVLLSGFADEIFPDPREQIAVLEDTGVNHKDGLAGSGKVVPAGRGDGNLEWILGQAINRGFRGFLSLEPHLKVDDPVYGGSGAERFARAVAALRQVLGRLGVEAE